MPRPSRARRILKWTGAGLSLFILAMWIGSMWIGSFILLPGDHAYIQFYANAVNIAFTNFDVKTYGTSTHIMKVHAWSGFSFFWPDLEIDRPMERPLELQSALVLPYWFLLLLTAIPTAWLWHRDRRPISSSPDHRLCSGCGYDLTGNLSGVCSECGMAKPPPATL